MEPTEYISPFEYKKNITLVSDDNSNTYILETQRVENGFRLFTNAPDKLKATILNSIHDKIYRPIISIQGVCNEGIPDSNFYFMKNFVADYPLVEYRYLKYQNKKPKLVCDGNNYFRFSINQNDDIPLVFILPENFVNLGDEAQLIYGNLIYTITTQSHRKIYFTGGFNSDIFDSRATKLTNAITQLSYNLAYKLGFIKNVSQNETQIIFESDNLCFSIGA